MRSLSVGMKESESERKGQEVVRLEAKARRGQGGQAGSSGDCRSTAPTRHTVLVQYIQSLLLAYTLCCMRYDCAQCSLCLLPESRTMPAYSLRVLSDQSIIDLNRLFYPPWDLSQPCNADSSNT